MDDLTHYFGGYYNCAITLDEAKAMAEEGIEYAQRAVRINHEAINRRKTIELVINRGVTPNKPEE